MLITTTLLAFSLSLAGAGGDCAPEWVPTFGGYPGASSPVRSFALHDDGSGPSVHVGFEGTLQGVATSKVARWNGVGFEAVGELAQFPTALVSFDDGNGPKLYGGVFSDSLGTSMVRVWDGQFWLPVRGGPIQEGPTVGGEVHSMVVHDDGSGAKLYVAGRFRMPTGELHFASFDGTSWSALPFVLGSEVLALHSATIAGENALYVGGKLFGGAAVRKWANGVWTALPTAAGHVRAFATMDFGSGPELVAAGGSDGSPTGLSFTAGVASNNVARWDGTQWRAVGQGFGQAVHSLAVLATSSGPQLCAGGVMFPGRGYVLANGQWAPMGSGFDQLVEVMLADDTGPSPKLWLGGGFVQSGPLALRYIATWDGSAVQPFDKGLDGPVRATAIWDDGSGPALYAGGTFLQGGGASLSRIGRFDGQNWQSLGNGLNGDVRALAVYDSGSGSQLYVGGSFTQENVAAGPIVPRIARWDGANWHPVGGGLGAGFDSSAVEALAVFDAGQGQELYAGGTFAVAGGSPAGGIARWNGAVWQPVAASITGGSVRALHVFDEGAGARLFVGGTFTAIDGVPATYIARFDGAQWSSVGGGMFGGPAPSVRSFATFDGGTGPALYAGGDFLRAGGVLTPGLARWNGAWSAVLGGVSGGGVHALVAGNDGVGDALFLGGSFTQAGAVPAAHVARFDGSGFAAMAEGQSATVSTLTYVDGGPLAGVHAGGEFLLANGSGDSYLGRWSCVPQAVVAVPGCAANPAALTSTATSAPLGQLLPLTLQSSAAQNGLAFLFAGPSGVGPDGCGLLIPGLGEWLLFPTPTPLLVQSAPLTGASANLSLMTPPQPSFAGLTLALQAAAFDPSALLELSNALSVTLGP